MIIGVMKTRIFLTTVGLVFLFSFPISLQAQQMAMAVLFLFPTDRVEISNSLFVRIRLPNGRKLHSFSAARCTRIAAVGVLKVFERAHIPIDLLVGNSMGSIIADCTHRIFICAASEDGRYDQLG